MLPLISKGSSLIVNKNSQKEKTTIMTKFGSNQANNIGENGTDSDRQHAKTQSELNRMFV